MPPTLLTGWCWAPDAVVRAAGFRKVLPTACRARQDDKFQEQRCVEKAVRLSSGSRRSITDLVFETSPAERIRFSRSVRLACEEELSPFSNCATLPP